MLGIDSKISLLPEHVIDQIKAGEVIDTAAGIIKELIENSLDAGSTKIDLHIKNSGLELISIEDNGKGIAYEDLDLAFARHATSKIENLTDLYKLSSFGFRGEALASLASVTKITCYSKTINSPQAMIVIDGGVVKTKNTLKANAKTGTAIYIKDLFYNTPVRLKFLQSKSSETNKIKKIIKYYLLSCPDVSFSIKWDDKEKIFYPSTSLNKRVEKILKFEASDYHVNEKSYDNLFGKIFISKQEKARPSQTIFINSRPIEDQKIKNIINHITLKNYHTKKLDWIIYFELPSHEVDVNVHPKKTQLRFVKSNLVYSFIGNLVKTASFENKQKVNQNIEFKIDNAPESNYQKTPLPIGNFQSTNSLNHNFQSPAPQKDYSVQTSDFKQKHNINNQTSTHFFLADLILVPKDQEYLEVYDINSIVESFLEKFSKTNDIVPLIISEPFIIENEFEKRKAELNFYNIEIDRIDSTTIILRSLPLSLTNLDYTFLFKKYFQAKELNFQKALKETLKNSSNISYLREEDKKIELKSNHIKELF